MFSKIVALAALLLMTSEQVIAHAAIAPVLGVAGQPKRANVQRPSKANPCGKTKIAANIDTSTPVVAAADGTFTVTVTNFNTGKDGSRQVAMTVDSTGTGENFVAGTVSKNGTLRPKDVTSEQITAALPAGTKCTGGASGDLCLASFKSAGNFGNCVVVQQAAAGGAAAASSAATDTVAAASATSAATATASVASASSTAAVAAEAPPNDATAATGKAGLKDKVKTALSKVAEKKQALKDKIKASVGTRAPRALRAELEARRVASFENDFDDWVEPEDDSKVAKRSLLGWVWA